MMSERVSPQSAHLSGHEPPAAAAAVTSDELLLCPLCDYDLRGLVEPRCPECGYTFDWADLRDPGRRKHKYLFEHHPERNVRSFLRTMLGHLLPRRFWGGLLPSQPSRPRRLFIYALVIVCSAILPPAALTAFAAAREWSAMSQNRRRVAAGLARPAQRPWYGIAGRPAATTQEVLDAFAPEPTLARVLEALGRGALGRTFIAHGALLLWPALTLAALMIFQISLHRARLRPIHFVRCVVYCADAIIWGNLLLTLAIAAYLLRPLLMGPRPGPDPEHLYGVAASLVAIAVLLAFTYRLIVAFKKYLRFDHPISTILATQVIVLLSMLLLLVNL
jgi:hypothetical protein